MPRESAIANYPLRARARAAPPTHPPKPLCSSVRAGNLRGEKKLIRRQ